MPSSIVIGTAGHIDHGKTTLVRALTGIDTDRLPEEKRRGITIDLGFASFDMPTPDGSPLRISFVDVPGHSLFIRNMLAGAGCVPAVMLVIAADEGIMPQTVEHLAICELLGISHGHHRHHQEPTQSALLSSQEVTNSIESISAGNVSLQRPRARRAGQRSNRRRSRSRASRTAATSRCARTSTPSDALMRMPLDRSFVMKGFGTVVTGTLLSGTIRDGQTLQLEPDDRAVRVRGLQTHGKSEQSAQPGSRVAVNLSGIDATEVRRGQTLVSPERFHRGRYYRR